MQEKEIDVYKKKMVLENKTKLVVLNITEKYNEMYGELKELKITFVIE